jgi:FecR protein/Putative zinc-finger
MNRLDQVVTHIANETVPEEQIERAAAKVRRKLFATMQAAPERIRGCADYQALIPSYLARTLSAGRALLLQDHTRECVACRHALEKAREGSRPVLIRPVSAPTNTLHKGWAIAAAVVLTLAVGALLVGRLLFPGSAGEASVESVHGTLYAISDRSTMPIFPGRKIPEHQLVRTTRGSTAVVRLGDGSLVEMNQRTELSLIKAVRGTRVHLDRGDIIVQAAKQRFGTLDVVTPDCTVAVKGTVFAVDLGTKGSRVSVVQGSVEVDQGARTVRLKPGEQFATSPAVGTTSVKDAVEWSPNSARYVALLGEFQTIEKGLEQMPSPALRHDSRLLAYAGPDTVLYAAIPNLGPTIAEADRLFNQRLGQSEVLREWWQQQNDGGKLEAMLQKLSTFSSYLGDEIVLTVSGDWQGNYSAPMIIAQVKNPGLEGFLNEQFSEWAAQGAHNLPKIVALKPGSAASETPLARTKASGGPMLVGLNDNTIVIGWNQAQLDAVAARIAGQPSDTPSNDLLAKVRDAYQNGVNYLLCVNMEHIARNLVHQQGDSAAKLPGGLESMQYLMVERKDIGGRTENQATLTFGGSRSGIAAWLASPSPMGSLDFVSPDATFVVSVATESPQVMLGDVFHTIAKNDPRFGDELSQFHDHTGISLSPSLAEPLGGEVTFALDGPVLPLPSWKLIVEVNNPGQLEWTIERFISTYNSHPACPNCALNLTQQQANGRTYYVLANPQLPYEIDYTFADGYLLVAPSRALLDSSIQNRNTGYMLSRSAAFRAQLPDDGTLNFSALIYHNLGSVLNPLASGLGALSSTTPAEKQSIQALAANSGAGLIYAYGGTDSITVASSGSFFGLNLNTFALPAIIDHLQGHPRAGGRAPKS